MCGRYVLATGATELAEAFGAPADLDVRPNWNIAPSVTVPIVVRVDSGSRSFVTATWGIDAPWSDRGLLINARSESVAEKRMFARLLGPGRCAVPMDGYYEWKRSSESRQGSKIPFFIRPRIGGPLAIGGTGAALGLFDRSAGRMVVLTRAAPPGLGAIHDRMPVLAGLDLVQSWLAGSAGPDDLAGPPPADDDMEWWEVDRAVNSSRSSGSSLVHPPRDESLFD
jgi:putative SOS response-associated peptidase YedK